MKKLVQWEGEDMPKKKHSSGDQVGGGGRGGDPMSREALFKDATKAMSTSAGNTSKPKAHLSCPGEWCICESGWLTNISPSTPEKVLILLASQIQY